MRGNLGLSALYYCDVIVFAKLRFQNVRREADVFKFLQFVERFRKVPFLWWVSVDGAPNASINVKPEGGRGGAYVGNLTSTALPILWNLTKNLGPRVGTFVFLRGGIGPSHIISFARLCAARL